MNTQWVIETHGDPLSSVQHFLREVWRQLRLDGMLVSQGEPAGLGAWLHVLIDPNQLAEVNPFKPLMMLNTARYLPDLLKAQPQARFGVLLRPCEMRALIEVTKHNGLEMDRLVTICVDCLGTLPADEYQWRAERKGTSGALNGEAIQFARQGGIVPYRYRSACQMCSSPGAHGADLNIYVLGLPVRQVVHVDAGNGKIAGKVELASITDGTAEPSLVDQRERMLSKVVERRERARDRVLHGLVESMPEDVQEVVSMMEMCGSCQECMSACAICAVDFPRQDKEGRYLPDDIARWLMSCDGCGMCEQVCPNHKPLTAYFTHVRDVLGREFGYTPGRSIREPLPVA